MIEAFAKQPMYYLGAFAQHLELVLITLAISIVLAGILTFLIMQNEKLTNVVIQIFSAIYSIPSLALFALLIPFTGLGDLTAVIVLVAYNQYLLIRNFIAGLRSVDKSIVEAGRGMGMSRFRLLREVQIPLAMPGIIAGIRLSIISTTGVATIAASINAGGLGTVLFSGMRTLNTYKILWGTILSVIIAGGADLSLKAVEKKLNRRNAVVSAQ